MDADLHPARRCADLELAICGTLKFTRHPWPFGASLIAAEVRTYAEKLFLDTCNSMPPAEVMRGLGDSPHKAIEAMAEEVGGPTGSQLAAAGNAVTNLNRNAAKFGVAVSREGPLQQVTANGYLASLDEELRSIEETLLGISLVI